jgi:hypothetical protein
MHRYLVQNTHPLASQRFTLSIATSLPASVSLSPQKFNLRMPAVYLVYQWLTSHADSATVTGLGAAKSQKSRIS